MDDQKLTTRVRNTIREEWGKLKLRSWKERLEYVWDYYKPLMVAILVIVILINIIVTVYRNLQIDTLLNVYAVNCNYDSTDSEELTSDFIEYIGGIGAKEEILIDTSIVLDDEDTTSYAVGYQMKFTAVISAQMADVVLMDAEKFEEYAGYSYFEDLSRILSEDQLEEWEELLVYMENEDGEEIPCAIDLTKSSVSEEYGLYSDTVYGGVVASAENTDLAIRFLEWMLSE